MALPLNQAPRVEFSRLRRPTVAAIHLAGLVAVAFISARGAMAHAEFPDGTAAVVVGAPLVAFLWLVVSGFFGYGSARRDDWVGLVPFCVALVVRELFTLHSVQEIEIQFAQGPVGRHSVVYPLLQMFFEPIVREPHAFTMHMNGVLGALACLAMYLFVRQRLESRSAGFLCALFLATHPIVARFSPTDGPYSLLLVTWFSGLAILSAPKLSARSMIGGAGLLGIAATTRMEGGVLLIASVLMLDLRLLAEGVRRHRVAAAVSILLVAAFAALQMHFLLSFHLSGPTSVAALIPPLDLLYSGVVFPASYNPTVFMWLVWLGAVAGLGSRYRLGLVAFLATLVVLAPVANSWMCGPIALHRMIPTCAVQTMVAGIGAYSLTAWIPSSSRRYTFAVLPGAVMAVWMLVQHRSDLTKPFVFTEEYELVRSHLARGRLPTASCTLLTFNSIGGQDVDIHDFRQVVPDVRVLDCRRADCVAEVLKGSCFYYARSAGCYFHGNGVPPACAAGVGAGVEALTCMDGPSASFEQAVELQPIEVRTIDILATFPDRKQNYPANAEVGLFRVRPRGRGLDRG